MHRVRGDAEARRRAGRRIPTSARVLQALKSSGGPRAATATMPAAAECRAHLLAEVGTAQSVQEEVDHVVGGGDDVGDLRRQEVGQVFDGAAPVARVLGVLVEGVGDGVGQAEADERHADAEEHQRQLALGRSAGTTGGGSGRADVAEASCQSANDWTTCGGGDAEADVAEAACRPRV